MLLSLELGYHFLDLVAVDLLLVVVRKQRAEAHPEQQLRCKTFDE
jgi:hypothetical protein